MSKQKYSIFCEKRDSHSNIVPGAVMVPTDDGKNQIWVLVKGKVYKNGWYRYWHNGKEGKVGPYRWVNLSKKPIEEAEGVVRKSNLYLLQTRNPKRTGKVEKNIFNAIDANVERIIQRRRIVRYEPFLDELTPIAPPTRPRTVILGNQGNILSEDAATV